MSILDCRAGKSQSDTQNSLRDDDDDDDDFLMFSEAALLGFSDFQPPLFPVNFGDENFLPSFQEAHLLSCNTAIFNLIPRPSSIEAFGKNVTGVDVDSFLGW